MIDKESNLSREIPYQFILNLFLLLLLLLYFFVKWISLRGRDEGAI